MTRFQPRRTTNEGRVRRQEKRRRANGGTDSSTYHHHRISLDLMRTRELRQVAMIHFHQCPGSSSPTTTLETGIECQPYPPHRSLPRSQPPPTAARKRFRHLHPKLGLVYIPGTWPFVLFARVSCPSSVSFKRRPKDITRDLESYRYQDDYQCPSRRSRSISIQRKVPRNTIQR